MPQGAILCPHLSLVTFLFDDLRLKKKLVQVFLDYQGQGYQRGNLTMFLTIITRVLLLYYISLRHLSVLFYPQYSAVPKQ